MRFQYYDSYWGIKNPNLFFLFLTMIIHLMAHGLISDYLPENEDLNRERYHPGMIALKNFYFLILRKNRGKIENRFSLVKN